jgi:hypothetical protein
MELLISSKPLIVTRMSTGARRSIEITFSTEAMKMAWRASGAGMDIAGQQKITQ